MNDDRTVVLELTSIEATHLAGLVTQFVELLDESSLDAGASPSDPAIARLVPDAYPGDADASGEFRSLTASDLLERRSSDAGTVLAGLGRDGTSPDVAQLSDDELLQTVIVPLDRDALGCWMRTLAALRLVLASRLGIRTEDDHEDDDPRFGIYDWLGYRLDGIVRAAEGTATE